MHPFFFSLDDKCPGKRGLGLPFPLGLRLAREQELRGCMPESCGQEQLSQAGQQAEALACRVTLDWVSPLVYKYAFEHSVSAPWDLVMYCQ